jgi:hypothetical protein
MDPLNASSAMGESRPLLINQPAPALNLLDIEGHPYALFAPHGSLSGTVRFRILNFWSAECPWSARADQALLAWLADWGSQVDLWTIAANINEPLELLQTIAAERGLPLVLDGRAEMASGHTASGLYQAQTTPNLFVIDRSGILRYQGALDDVTFRQRSPTRSYLRLAIEALLAGRQPDPAETQPYGCTIVRYIP